MNKILITAACAAMFMVSCQSKDATQEVIDLTKATTEKIEKAKDMKEMNEIAEKYAADIEELHKKYPDYRPTEEQKKEIAAAAMEMASATLKKTSLPAPDADVLDLPDDSK